MTASRTGECDHAAVSAPTPRDGDVGSGLARFLDDLRRTGTVITGPVLGEPESPWVDERPVEWLVEVHRGERVDPPYRLRLDERQFADALEHDTSVVDGWWPGGDPRSRAYEALLLSFDAALVGVDRTPHGFVLEGEDRLRLTTHHLCPDPLPHLAAEGIVGMWSAYEPGTPEFEAEQAQHARRSPHRRHADLVRAWLVVETAMDTARVDPAVTYLQDQVALTFGGFEAMTRFSRYVEAQGWREEDLTAVAYEDDERFDGLLDALAGEPRDA